MSAPAQTRVLVVVNDPGAAGRVCLILEHAGYVTTCAHSAEDARRAVLARTPDMVLVAAQLGDADGLDVCRWIKSAPGRADVLVILLSDSPAGAGAVEDPDSEADACLPLSAADHELLARVASYARVVRVTRAFRAEAAHRRQLEAELRARLTPAPPIADHRSLPRGTETILAVEDEPSILTLVRTLLERLGYTVLTAATPLEALAIARANGHRVDLLMADVVMPDMSGPMLAEALAPYYPTLRTLFMSGYAPSILDGYGIDADSPNFLEKPFAMSALAVRLRATLDRPLS